MKEPLYYSDGFLDYSSRTTELQTNITSSFSLLEDPVTNTGIPQRYCEFSPRHITIKQVT